MLFDKPTREWVEDISQINKHETCDKIEQYANLEFHSFINFEKDYPENRMTLMKFNIPRIKYHISHLFENNY